MTLQVQAEKLEVAAGESVLLPETSFTLQAPGLIALTGPNGAGKTTLLKTLAGRQLPSSGQCLIGNLTAYEFDPAFRAAVASLIDTPPMARDMTLNEQLMLVRLSWGDDDDEARFGAEQCLARLTIPHLGDRFPYELSSGQLQLFALALTLSRPFEVLLLDEPERHLDAERVVALLDVLDQHVDRGALIITATHRQEIIDRNTHRIHLVRDAGS
ncbi:ABC transporter ATP-binding protein [Nesterenkonia rhizosphaerae]|uniref:ABC transporter ATP-binding protein n=1 Tax=Nesterenkonia rhizosphaerae TaxID=1348272 RepID=A0ABP9G3U6_9MICC